MCWHVYYMCLHVLTCAYLFEMCWRVCLHVLTCVYLFEMCWCVCLHVLTCVYFVWNVLTCMFACIDVCLLVWNAEFVVVHNGIITNYKDIKKFLVSYWFLYVYVRQKKEGPPSSFLLICRRKEDTCLNLILTQRSSPSYWTTCTTRRYMYKQAHPCAHTYTMRTHKHACSILLVG